jgi:hypothetical protein
MKNTATSIMITGIKEVIKMLTHRESLGFDFEHHIYDALRASGLSSYLTFKNPLNDKAAWHRQRGHGADFKLQLPNGAEYIIEAKYRISQVEERDIWYKQDVASRFHSTNPNAKRLLVTNMPQAFKAAAKRSMSITNLQVTTITVNQLISLLTNQLTNINKIIINATNTINSYSYRYELTSNSQLSVNLIGSKPLFDC